MNSINPLYLPYGAYELKAAYQRNMLIANSITFIFIGMILTTTWIASAFREAPVIPDTPARRGTYKELPQPPVITRKKPQVSVEQPKAAKREIGTPTPVDDSLVLDDDVVIIAPRDYADINPVTEGEGMSGDIVFEPGAEDFIPTQTDFVPVEIYPVMIHEVAPEYPRFALQAGLEGTVHINVLVMPDGSVRDAAVYHSSGVKSLDEAALRVAKQNVFKPGIQNGHPVACWVVYKVDFELTR